MLLSPDETPVPLGPGRYRAVLDERWNVAGSIPNGGYLAAVLLAAAGSEVAHPDPVTVTTHFVRPAHPGPAEMTVGVVRAGDRHTTVSATLVQRDTVRAVALAAFGDLASARGPTAVTGRPPELPDPDTLPSSRDIPGLPAIAHTVDMRIGPSHAGGVLGRPAGSADIAGWIGFPSPPDVSALLIAADAMPPAVLNLLTAHWVPTLELTVHVRARPAPGWLRARFVTRYLIHGYLEEDGEIWDAAGRLVALSRQLALIQERG